MPGSPRAIRRLGATTIALLIAVAGAVTPAAAWSNNGDGYGSHDWILDQALRLMTARGMDISWVDSTTALLATDDPDNIEVKADPSREIEHVYTGDGGRRGGAVHRITEHYAAMQRAYNAHDYQTASYNLGMLAHFYGDILQPFHTSRDAIGQTTTHRAYELLVDDLNRHPTDSPGWSVANTSWVVKDMPNVRTSAIAAAAYSRARYLTLAANFSATDTKLSSAAATVTKEVLIRASGDLADLISSVPKGIGNPPPVGSITYVLRYRGVKTNEASERLDGTVKDINGNPIEGVRVDVKWPMPDGTTQIMPFWTDGNGVGHIYGIVGSNPYMQHNTVTLTSTTNLKTVTASTWWYRTKRLADGSAGFKTTVNDSTVHAGQVVTASAVAKTSTGEPIVGLLVNFTWTLGSTTVKTSAYTDSTGKAKSTFTVLSSTSRSTLYVKGSTTAYSINRSSTASFHRTD
ncbi:MAG TPA: hypothetical protein VJ850_06825 [Candidatus Limnocylindrales bacterium]|nr:hypothetical protein [Candidatus Limnocylindrales bacterium]